LNVAVGSPVTVITRDSNGTYDARDFTVVGILSTGHPLFDQNAVLMSIKVAQELLAVPGSVTELSIKSKDDNNLKPLKEKISQKIGKEYEVFTWKELYASIFEVSGFKRTFQFLLALVVVIIAAVGIVKTMLMAVMERIPEIGTLKAMGFSNFNISKMFIYEGGIIGVFGSLIGSLFGILVSLYLTYYGIDLSRHFQNINIPYPIKFIIKGEIDYSTIFMVFIFGVIVAVLVTLLPVRRATKFEPSEALRHV
jgi:ABC-type lipoprotein release transport system permease subunit